MRKILLAGIATPLMATAALAQQVCEYRLGRPVWHFIPEANVDDEFSQDALYISQLDDYSEMQESGAVISQLRRIDEGFAAEFDERHERRYVDQVIQPSLEDGEEEARQRLSNARNQDAEEIVAEIERALNEAGENNSNSPLAPLIKSLKSEALDSEPATIIQDFLDTDPDLPDADRRIVRTAQEQAERLRKRRTAGRDDTPYFARDTCADANSSERAATSSGGATDDMWPDGYDVSCDLSFEAIEQFGADLFELDTTERRRPGVDRSAKIPYGAYLNPNWHYLRISMVQANLIYSRRLFSMYFPAVHTNIAFDTLGGAASATGVSTQDTTIYDLDRRRVRRTMALNQVILPPTPYIGGDVRAEVAVIGVESIDMGRAFLRFLNDITDKVGGELLSAANPIFNIIDEGIEHLAGTDSDNQFLEAGVASNWPKPRTGYWVILWPSQDFIDHANTDGCTEPPSANSRGLRNLIENRPGGGEPFSINQSLRIRRISPDEVILTVTQNEMMEGARGEVPLDNATWALIRVEALETNPNWQRIPTLAERRQKIIEKMVRLELPGVNPDPARGGDNAGGASGSNSGNASNTNGEEERKVLEREIDHDLQEYFGTILSSTDLLAVDKYEIIRSEQNAFARHMNVLQAVPLREDFIEDAYNSWRALRSLRGQQWLRELERRRCELEKRVGERANNAPCPPKQGSAPSEQSSAKEEAGNSEGADSRGADAAEATTNGAGEATGGDTPNAQFMSASRAIVEFDNATLAVQKLVESDPQFAREIGFRGADSIDGAMVVAAMTHPRGRQVRDSVSRGLEGVVDISWARLSEAGLTKILQTERPKPIDMSISDRDERRFD